MVGAAVTACEKETDRFEPPQPPRLHVWYVLENFRLQIRSDQIGFVSAGTSPGSLGSGSRSKMFGFAQQ